MTKKEMIEKMNQRGWTHELTEENSREEIDNEYEEMMDEISDDSSMFPNGRDFDAEDEDGPCGS